MKIPGLGDLLQQMQFVQKQVGELQETLEKKRIEGSAGGGMVTIELTGALSVVSVKIDPTVVNPGDVEMLEDLVQAAAGDALRKAKELIKEQIKEQLAQSAGAFGM